jgi:NAD(P)-dependent dehydrogenase (short-subunit alcohol dehydrogenase family)
MNTAAARERTWWITGVRSGFGRSVALAALARGDRVIGTVRHEEDRAAIDALAPGRSRAILLDVTNERMVTAAVEAAIGVFGTPDVVVNNAGYGLFGTVEEVGDAELRAQFDTNVYGVWNVLRAVLPHLRARRSGHIVQMSSIGGLLANPGSSAYNASKFALEGMSEALAFEVAPFGIAVTLVEPGPFRTAFAGSSARFANTTVHEYALNAEAQRERLGKLDGNQPGDPEKAAAAILRLVDSEHPPVRLVLGESALQRARAHLAWVQREFDAWEEVSRSTEIGDAPTGVGAHGAFAPPVLKR